MIIVSKVLIQSMKTPFFSCYEEKILGKIPFSQHFPFFFFSEHTKNARKSTSNKHQKGQARKNRDRQRAKGNRRG